MATPVRADRIRQEVEEEKMSIKLMTIVWDMDIPTGEKMVLLKLADRANDDGECWPGQESIAKQCSMSIRAVRDNLNRIQARGLVEPVSVRKGNRQGKTVYRLNLQAADSAPSKTILADSHPAESAASKIVSGGSLRHSQAAVCDIAYKEEPSSEPPVVFTNVNTPPLAPSNKPGIEFDPEDGIFKNVTEAVMQRWEEAYPKLDIDAELTRAELWYTSNPRKRKKNHHRFLTNWLARAHDRLTTPPTRRPFPKQQLAKAAPQ